MRWEVSPQLPKQRKGRHQSTHSIDSDIYSSNVYSRQQSSQLREQEPHNDIQLQQMYRTALKHINGMVNRNSELNLPPMKMNTQSSNKPEAKAHSKQIQPVQMPVSNSSLQVSKPIH